MERQLPKNVRQIGNVCDEPKIYVEDYVDTFLGQLQEKAMEKPVAAALTGEITKCEDKVVVYISGAIRAEDVEVEGTNLKISEEIWEKIEKQGNRCYRFTGRHFWNRKCRKKTWWQQEFAVFKCEATANSVTGHVCVNSNSDEIRTGNAFANSCIFGIIKTLN